MALSSSESALLTETCENMNIAANTCHEVLEMLRNLGNTGVVDIATHNNATDPHANAKNIFHVNNNGRRAQLGSAGETGIASIINYWPFGIELDAAGKIRRVNATNGVFSNYYPSDLDYIAVSDSSHNFIDIADAHSFLGANTSAPFVGVHTYQTAFLDDVSLQSGFSYHIGDRRRTAGTGAFTSTSIEVWATEYNGSSYANSRRYEFSPAAFSCFGTQSLGLSGASWDTAYLRTAATVTSDRREKSGISAIGSEAVEFIKALRPVHFTVKVGRQAVMEVDENGTETVVETTPGTRRHWGLIAQEVQEALVSAGYDPSACAVWSLADKNDPDSKQALRYEELIAPMIKVIQQQQERIEALERKVA